MTERGGRAGLAEKAVAHVRVGLVAEFGIEGDLPLEAGVVGKIDAPIAP
jgi:hypothetical protein